MGITRVRLYVAGLVALLLGVPLTEKALAADAWDITGAALGLGFSIADASSGKS